MNFSLAQVTPNLIVADIRASILFYEQFGFQLRIAVPMDKKGMHNSLQEGVTYLYAQIVHGSLELMLQLPQSIHEDVGVQPPLSDPSSVVLYFSVGQLANLFAAVKDHVEIVQPLHTTWYGMDEFYAKDLDGHLLGFAEQKK